VSAGYDAVIVNKPFDFPILWRARRRGLLAQTLFRSGGRDFYAGDRLFGGAIQHWVSASRYNARQVEARYGRPVTVIHNGVDADAFAPRARDGELRRSLGAGPGDLLVVSVSRLIGWKGVRVVIEALAALPARVRYLVVGEGPEAQALRRAAAAAGLEERVRFMGRVRHADLPLLLSQCDVFVQPSIGEEAFGISVVEAMACGLPVLASDNGGLPEIVVDGETGRLLPPGSVPAWREAIASADADRARREREGARASRIHLGGERRPARGDPHGGRLMCGIVGAVLAGGGDVRLDDAVACLEHRGPDQNAAWREGEARLGFRRLAIIDLSEAGHQPMHSPDGRYVVVFNGEIYNFRELRDELEAKGERFRGHSDTEVLLRLFAREGLERCLERLRGMFAFAVWDRQERRLSLARDRLGVKPLVYAQTP